MTEKKTCSWPSDNPLMIEYHDKEWGVPVHDDQKHFEFMVLDAFQAGLSWAIVLKKRVGFRKAFDNFDFRKVAKYDDYIRRQYQQHHHTNKKILYRSALIQGQ